LIEGEAGGARDESALGGTEDFLPEITRKTCGEHVAHVGGFAE